MEKNKENNLEKEVIDIIANVLEVDKSLLNVNTNLTKDLDVESLDLVDLVVAFEDKYNLEIPDPDIKNLQTIQDIIDYLNKNV